ncbi:hypothetical protein XHV734_0248 [Xanthomonas hortorum pv. vitians]|nr:hypothetical protein XHV734_0248 [Xanthomonas hortorum pv. vitians]
MLAGPARPRDAGSGIGAHRLYRTTPGRAHLRSDARHPGQPGGRTPRRRALAAGGPQPRAGAVGSADAQRPDRRLPWHAHRRDRPAGAAAGGRHRTGDRPPDRLLVALIRVIVAALVRLARALGRSALYGAAEGAFHRPGAIALRVRDQNALRHEDRGVLSAFSR